MASSECVSSLLEELQARDPALGVSETQDTLTFVLAALHEVGLGPHLVDSVLDAMDLPARGVIEPFTGAKELLARIRGLGLRCVVFSNATYRTGAAYRRDFSGFSLGDYIDAIVSSVELGYRKPSHHMFRAATEAAGCAYEHCVVIGDSEVKDIAPASNLGMATLRVAIETPPPPSTMAQALATSLPAVAETLSRWSEH